VIEVTPEYAEYLRKDYGPGWELRLGKDGDTVMVYTHSGDLDVVLAGDLTDRGPSDRGIRWVKVKPAMEWREYAVSDNAYIYHIPEKGIPLSCAMDCIGFGGVQYRRLDGTLTSFAGYLPCNLENGPVTPVKVQFWEAKS
jgi:hypothetical protein